MIALAFATLIALLLVGLPIFAALGGLSMALLLFGGTPGIGIAQLAIDKLNGQTVLAVPFFVIAAQFMEKGGIARALIDLSDAWLGRLRGGLALTCIAATCVFAAVSGSSVATALAMATILVPAMVERSYDRSLAMGVVGASGTLGILIPPSIILVIYGLIAEVSIPRLFLAGVVPGLLQAALFAAFVLYVAHRDRLPNSPARDLGSFLRANLHAVPAALVPVVIFVGIYGGYATIAESAGLAALLAIMVSVFFYRGCSFAEILPICAVALRRSAAIILIVVAALLFSHWLTETRVAVRMVEAAVAMDVQAWQFLLILCTIMLLLGTVLEGLSIVLIIVPLVLPLFGPLDINPIQFAIVVVISIEIAMLTPPVGLNLFVLSGVTNAPVNEVIRGVLPFLALMILLLIAVTFLPDLSLWLPDFVLG